MFTPWRMERISQWDFLKKLAPSETCKIMTQSMFLHYLGILTHFGKGSNLATNTAVRK